MSSGPSKSTITFPVVCTWDKGCVNVGTGRERMRDMMVGERPAPVPVAETAPPPAMLLRRERFVRVS